MALGVDTILVSFNPCDQNGDEILIVGRKEPGKKDATIINAFQGKEAVDLYEKLTVRKVIPEV